MILVDPFTTAIFTDLVGNALDADVHSSRRSGLFEAFDFFEMSSVEGDSTWSLESDL
ncbi:unnamed protein product [Rodentolepis nana]|uniref:Uncharacterized protein n=1 Tax=Rodentolepis nana TaxID=102285 RepID=A0A0R3TB52_RODNA|nr:unnamed protein product [Rodentolepis nana]